MKCLKCGFESEADFNFCPQCSEPAPANEALENPAAKRALGLIKDKLFLIVAILISITTLLSFSKGGIPVINVLLTVFVWVLYSKGAKNIADSSNIRNISGTVYASYIVTYVLAIILAVCGLIMAAAMSFIQLDNAAIDEFKGAFTDMAGIAKQVAEAILSISAFSIILIFGVVCAIMFIFNIAGLRNIHKFIKSVYISIDTANENYHKPNTARAWLLALGILKAVSAIASADIENIISGGSFAAALIITSILVEKHFLSVQKEQPQLQEPIINE